MGESKPIRLPEEYCNDILMYLRKSLVEYKPIRLSYEYGMVYMKNCVHERDVCVQFAIFHEFIQVTSNQYN